MRVRAAFVVICVLFVASAVMSQVTPMPLTTAQKQEMLDATNDVRCHVSPAAASMPAMTWDNNLQTVAQNYANTCAGLVHNPNRTAQYDALTGTSEYVGENIYASTGPLTMTDAVNAWASEAANYNFATNTCAANQVCGHYTQLVWAGTLRVGCGYAQCPAQQFQYSLICDYAPGGNVNNQPPYTAGSGPNDACNGARVLLARGDINGDNKGDIIWRNYGSGGNSYWLMSGTGIITSGPLPLVGDTNFYIVGLGDFQGDGKSDILWRNQSTGVNVMWLMNGPTLASSALLTTVADTNWIVAGVGDFQGDGKADIVWRNASSGANSIWIMNGSSIAVSASLPAVPDTNWKIVGLGDLQGDSKADIVWRNSLTGDNSVWFMNGAGVAVSASLTSVGGPAWQIVRISDFQGDGKADLFWRNSVTGANVVWLMNGPTIAASAVLPVLSDTNWKVAAQP